MGISVHIGTIASGLAFIGTLLKPALDATGTTLERLQAIPNAMANDADYQKLALVSGGAYVAIRAARSSIEKRPLISVGKLSIFAL